MPIKHIWRPVCARLRQQAPPVERGSAPVFFKGIGDSHSRGRRTFGAALRHHASLCCVQGAGGSRHVPLLPPGRAPKQSTASAGTQAPAQQKAPQLRLRAHLLAAAGRAASARAGACAHSAAAAHSAKLLAARSRVRGIVRAALTPRRGAQSVSTRACPAKRSCVRKNPIRCCSVRGASVLPCAVKRTPWSSRLRCLGTQGDGGPD